jgi:hypothetical protein
MDIQDGRPSPANAPYFDEFRVELALSEPDYRIGIDEEVISSLEALHEDIYFETLTLFDLIGGRYGVGNLNHAGRMLPWIRNTASPGPGTARIAFTGKERGVPELVLVYRERGGEPVRMRYALSPLPTEPPKLRGVAVRAGDDGLSRLLFDVEAVDSIDRYDEMRQRATEPAIDRTLLPAPLLEGMLRSLRAMHAEGVLRDALSPSTGSRAALPHRPRRRHAADMAQDGGRAAHGGTGVDGGAAAAGARLALGWRADRAVADTDPARRERLDPCAARHVPDRQRVSCGPLVPRDKDIFAGLAAAA